MAGDIELCSKALLKLGEKPISSFTDGTDVSSTCGELWPDFTRYCLSLHDWSFARKKRQLSRLVDTPENEYAYAFQMPSDGIKILAVYDSGEQGAVPVVNYDIFYKQIYFDGTELWVDYIAEVNESDFPPYFVEFITTAFAADLALSVTDKTDYHQLFYNKAFGSNQSSGDSGLLGRAKNIDSKQTPPKVARYNGLLGARFSGAY